MPSAPNYPPGARVRLRGSPVWRVVRRAWVTQAGEAWVELAPHGREKSPTPVPVAKVTTKGED